MLLFNPLLSTFPLQPLHQYILPQSTLIASAHLPPDYSTDLTYLIHVSLESYVVHFVHYFQSTIFLLIYNFHHAIDFSHSLHCFLHSSTLIQFTTSSTTPTTSTTITTSTHSLGVIGYKPRVSNSRKIWPLTEITEPTLFWLTALCRSV